MIRRSHARHLRAVGAALVAVAALVLAAYLGPAGGVPAGGGVAETEAVQQAPGRS
jgi:hypothetical protein